MYYQGYQKVVKPDEEGLTTKTVKVMTYCGSQYGWLTDYVCLTKVSVTKTEQLRKLGRLISSYKVALINKELQVYATVAYLTARLTHEGDLQ